MCFYQCVVGKYYEMYLREQMYALAFVIRHVVYMETDCKHTRTVAHVI